jgi:Fe2+ transport system protein FeoA/GTP-binding protein EngB required for normal cell division
MANASKTGNKLDKLHQSGSAVVLELAVQGDFRRRLLDLGFVPGTMVKAMLQSPDRGMMAYRVKGANVALRPEDAAKILITDDLPKNRASSIPLLHKLPNGKRSEPSVPQNKKERCAGPLTVALAGNPNTGKSTVFNALTGLRQHVGNWPGKTVARFEGIWRHGDRQYRVVDLPGTYSLLSQSPEEEISCEFLFEQQPDCVVVVADATCLERNLNLTFQIMELAPTVVLCVNLLDQAQRLGLKIKAEVLEEQLGIPVVMTCAHRSNDVARLADTVDAVLQGRIDSRPVQVCYNPAIEGALSELTQELKPYLRNVAACRWVAMRLINGDKKVGAWFQEQVRKLESLASCGI